MKFNQSISAGYTLGAIHEIDTSEMVPFQRAACRFVLSSNADLNLKDSEPENRQLFSVLSNLITRGFPTFCSPNVERLLGKIYGKEIGFAEDADEFEFRFKIPELNPDFLKKASVLVEPRCVSINKALNEFQGSAPAKAFYDSLPNYVKQYTQPERLFTDGVLINEQVGAFYRRQVDFAIETPTGLKWIIEVDGSQHSRIPQQLIDLYRDEALYESGWKVLRVPTSATDYQASEFKQFREAVEKDKTIMLARESVKDPIWSSERGFNIQHLVLGPLAIGRVQLAICKVLLSGNLNLKKESLDILCIERDVTTSTIAIEDLFEQIQDLSKLTGFPILTPRINLDIIASEEYSSNQRLLQGIEFKHISKYQFIDEKAVGDSTYNLIMDISTLEKTGLSYRKDHSGLLREAGIKLQIRSDFNCTPIPKIEGDRPIQYPDFEESALEKFLHLLFRKKAFRDGQVKIMRRALSGQDTIGLLPTGSGKSLCYQLATLLQPGISIIIEPLKALMVDQHRNLKNFLIEHCVYINSDIDSTSRKEIEQRWARSEYQYIWVSPERLQIKEFRGYLQKLTRTMPVSYAVIDEAHCVSEWGHDFRTSYLMMSKTLRKYCEYEGHKPIFYGLTATASETVLKDIEIELVKNSQGDPKIKPDTFDRSELNFRIYNCESSQKFDFFKNAVSEICSTFNVNADELFTPSGRKTRSGLVFCPHVTGTDFSISKLSAKIAAEYNFQQIQEIKEPGTPMCPNCDIELVERTGANGSFWGCSNYPRCRHTEQVTDGKIQYYDRLHMFGGKVVVGFDTGSWDEYKIKAQNEFIEDKVPLMISTKAFGMGIDKPNIRYTIHYNIPSSLESFYQEAGRAGRDRKEAVNVILFSDDSKEDARERLSTKKTAEEVQEMKRLPRNEEGDVHRMLFFQSMSFKGFEQELDRIREILNFELYVSYSILAEGSTTEVTIEEKGGNTEKALYRLSLIGLIEDYTIEFSHPRFYQVHIRKLPFEKHCQILYSYIRRHGIPQQDSAELRDHIDTEEDFYKYVESREYNHFLTKCSAVLLEYIYATIEPQRRRALLNLVNALESGDPNTFRKNMLRYLSPDEEYNELYGKFPDQYNHETIDAIFEKASDEDARNKLLGIALRYLESYPSNPGLLILSSGLRLSLPGENPKLAMDDFEASLSEANTMEGNEENEFVFKSLLFFLSQNKDYYPASIVQISIQCSNTLNSKEFDSWLYDTSPLERVRTEMAVNLAKVLSSKTRKLITRIKG